MNELTQNYPISKYIGTFPKGKWEFVKCFFGTYKDVLREVERLQKEDPKTGIKKNYYRIWDQR